MPMDKRFIDPFIQALQHIKDGTSDRLVVELPREEEENK